MTVNTTISLDFTEAEVIDILKQHIVKQGYKYTAHTPLIVDIAEADSLGSYTPEFEFQGYVTVS
jgi:diphthamide biosynthesis methyltransferase